MACSPIPPQTIWLHHRELSRISGLCVVLLKSGTYERDGICQKLVARVKLTARESTGVHSTCLRRDVCA